MLTLSSSAEESLAALLLIICAKCMLTLYFWSGERLEGRLRAQRQGCWLRLDRSRGLVRLLIYCLQVSRSLLQWFQNWKRPVGCTWDMSRRGPCAWFAMRSALLICASV